MSDDKKPEESGSGQSSDDSSPGGDGSSSSSSTRRQQSNDARRSNSSDSINAGGSGNTGGAGGGRQGSRRRHRGERENQTAPRRAETSINMDELRELADLITAQGFTEFELEKEGFRLCLSRNTYSQSTPNTVHSSAGGGVIPFPAPPPTAGSAAPPVSNATSTAATPAVTLAAADTSAGAVEDLHKITSPIVGTFYRAPSPTSDVFVNQGSRVAPESVVCIIEAMKLMNEIQAEVSGTIEKIYVENGQPVEYGQALFGVKK